MRQLIIARKDLHMSPGKLAAQVSHASLAYFSYLLRNSQKSDFAHWQIQEDGTEASEKYYRFQLDMPADIYDDWFGGVFTKTVCEARNKNQLLKAVKIAEELGLEKGKDFFLIYDACLTELEPEETNDNGAGVTLTAVGFKPLSENISHAISKKFQLYR